MQCFGAFEVMDVYFITGSDAFIVIVSAFNNDNTNLATVDANTKGFFVVASTKEVVFTRVCWFIGWLVYQLVDWLVSWLVD